MFCSIEHSYVQLVSVVYPLAQSPPRRNLAAVHTQPHSSHVCAAQNMFTGTHTHTSPIFNLQAMSTVPLIL